MKSKSGKVICNKCGSLYDLADAGIPEGATICSLKCTCERKSESGFDNWFEEHSEDIPGDFGTPGTPQFNECCRISIELFHKCYTAGKAEALTAFRKAFIESGQQKIFATEALKWWIEEKAK